jgi:hypothetical protein
MVLEPSFVESLQVEKEEQLSQIEIFASLFSE